MSNYLSERRKELGLTQKEVADAVGVAEATVSRWESGEIANMRRDRISALAKIGHLTNRVDLIDLPNCKQKFTNVEGVIG